MGQACMDMATAEVQMTEKEGDLKRIKELRKLKEYCYFHGYGYGGRKIDQFLGCSPPLDPWDEASLGIW